MTGHKDCLTCLSKKDYTHKVHLGDYYQYPIKGMGEDAYKLQSRKSMNMKEFLYVLVLHKNLVSIWALDKKVFRVYFVDGEVIMWLKGKTIDDDTIIGVE